MRQIVSILILLGVVFPIDDHYTHDTYSRNKWEISQAMQNSDRDMLPEQTWYDVISYSIDIEINPSTEMVDGQVTIEIQVTQPGVDFIVLDAADHLNITNVTSDSDVTFIHENHRLTVNYEGALPENVSVPITITYNGDTNSGYIWSGGIVYSGNYFWSLGCPYGLHKWVPCKDHPSDKAEWLDLLITVPEIYVVASNGSRIGVENNNDGTRTHHWHESYPIAPYLFCINAYPYNEYTEYFEYGDGQTMPIMYFVPTTVPTGFTYVETAIPVFSELFGLYPFVEEKYAIAKVTANFGAMEHQNCVSTSVTNGMTMVHELAHQWFGDKVTCMTWQHSWLNEGFATYCEALYVQETQNMTAYHNYMNGMQFSWNDNLTLFVTDTTDFAPIFNGIVYDKGAWVNHMLRGVVGDEIYFEAVNDYLDIYAYENADTDDLKEVFETHYGEDLDWFFEEWVYWNGHPDYDYQWASTTDTFYLVVNQSSTGTIGGLFSMPVEFALTLENGSTIVETFWIEGETSSFNIPVSSPVTAVSCDPDNWILNDASGSGTTEFSLADPEVEMLDAGANGFAEPGEDFQINVTLTNMGIPFDMMTGILSCQNANVEILQEYAQFNGAGPGGTTTTVQPFELHLSEYFQTEMVWFSLDLGWQGYTDQVFFQVPLGTPYTLVVNMAMDVYLSNQYDAILQEAGQVVYHWTIGSAMTLQELIPEFGNILFFVSGDMGNPIPPEIAGPLTDHLNGGGNLLLMGQNLGNELGGTDFYQDVLQAQYLGEHEGYIIYGNDDHPLIQGENLLINHPEDCDVLDALGDAQMAYEYSGGNGVAGIISENPGRLLYTGFEMLSILNTGGWGQSPAEFVSMIMSWFNTNSVPGDVNHDEILDILDIVMTINIIMGIIEPSDYQLNAGDLNDDGMINVLDIIQMVNAIVGS